MEKKAYLAGGCFWGLEAKMQSLPGVIETEVGYAGGITKNPTYLDVCRDTTGHVETVFVVYEPDQLSYQQLLEAFFSFHDPTTCCAQGITFGTQYRSCIFYLTEEEKQIAEQVIAFLEVSGIYNKPIVTRIVPLEEFYPAEEYHQDYYRRHGLIDKL